MSRVSKSNIKHSLEVRTPFSEELVPVTPIELLMDQPRDSIQHHSKETEEFSLRLAYRENLLQPDECYEVKRLNPTTPKDK